MGKGVSKRQQLAQALRAAQQLQGGQQVVPRDQRFVAELIQSRKQIHAWRTDMEKTIQEAERLGFGADTVEFFREHLAEVAQVEDRLTRIYVTVLEQDLKEPVFVTGAAAMADKLEADLKEMQAEKKDAQPPVADAAASTETPAPEEQKLVLLPGQG